MDLVTDYKEIYDNGTNAIVYALKNVSCNIESTERRDFYREVDKFYRAISIWKIGFSQFSRDVNRDKLIDNVLYDYCSIVNNVAVGDIKVLYFLLRNIIESILRYVLNKLESRELDKMFSEISVGYGNQAVEKYLQMYASQLKQIYDESCLYIHADTNKIEKDLCTLISRNNANSSDQLNKLRKYFVRVNVATICILRIKASNVFELLQENAQGYLNFIIPLEERIKLNQILQMI